MRGAKSRMRCLVRQADVHVAGMSIALRTCSHMRICRSDMADDRPASGSAHQRTDAKREGIG